LKSSNGDIVIWRVQVGILWFEVAIYLRVNTSLVLALKINAKSCYIEGRITKLNNSYIKDN